LPYEKLDDAAALLTQALANFPPFQLKFSGFSSFPHGTVWLSPTATPSSAVVDLQALLERTFPLCDDLGKHSESGFTPHLTVGQAGKGPKNIQKLTTTFEKDWSPIEFTVSEIYIIQREAETPFRVAHAIPLGSGVSSSSGTVTSFPSSHISSSSASTSVSSSEISSTPATGIPLSDIGSSGEQGKGSSGKWFWANES